MLENSEVLTCCHLLSDTLLESDSEFTLFYRGGVAKCKVVGSEDVVCNIISCFCSSSELCNISLNNYLRCRDERNEWLNERYGCGCVNTILIKFI